MSEQFVRTFNVWSCSVSPCRTLSLWQVRNNWKMCLDLFLLSLLVFILFLIVCPLFSSRPTELDLETNSRIQSSPSQNTQQQQPHQDVHSVYFVASIRRLDVISHNTPRRTLAAPLPSHLSNLPSDLSNLLPL
jgi:hypothetical protein